MNRQHWPPPTGPKAQPSQQLPPAIPPAPGPPVSNSAEWKPPPFGAPLGVWGGVVLILLGPLIAVALIAIGLEPVSQAAFDAFEGDDSGFFLFLAGFIASILYVVFALIVGVGSMITGLALMITSGIIRKRP